ncbi:solute carrier family 51 subunit beta [Sardina pilchardus]|uniref:solute carrier family 51 subunit beta n=1 Tax=Sardina pilchardus TaxID=27697 RepID=UPI002E165EF6
MMSLLWVPLCLILHGANAFMIHNTVESLCLQDSPAGKAVTLRKCNLDNDLQQWVWREQRFLRNVGTQRCLSAFHARPVLSVECDGGEYLEWSCENHRLLSLNRSLELSAEKGRVRLTPGGPNSRWKSPDLGDICQERLRSKRASNEFEEEFEESKPAESTMNEEQREFLKWFYRTEDQSKWTLALLGLAFAALLLGCILLVTGMMGNRSRKKIAKYKAVALALRPQMEELQVITVETASRRRSSAATENGQLKPGDIEVTWRDGTVSSLYAERGGEADGGEAEEEVKQEEVKQEEVKEEEQAVLVEEEEEEEVQAHVEVEGNVEEN